MESLRQDIVRESHARARVALDPLPTDITPTRTMIPHIQAVLFDIYGTLLISGSGDVGTAIEASQSQPFKRTMIEAGIPEPDDGTVKLAEKLFIEKIGDSHAASRLDGIDFPEVDILSVWDEVLAALSAAGIPTVPIEEKTVVRIAATHEAAVNPVCIMPNAVETLATLRGAELHLGIVSNAQFYTQILLEYELGMTIEDAGFNRRLCSYSYLVGAAKPSQLIFRPVLGELSNSYGIPPSGVLYVGNDMLNDISTAGVAGCRTCLFAGDRRSLRLRENHELLSGLTPDAIITNLSQLPDTIGP